MKALGPNLCAVPPGGMTTIHKDGRGSADSGHMDLAGYNEVVMFPSLPPDGEQIVFERLGVDVDVNVPPHEVEETHRWPTAADIKFFEDEGWVSEVHLSEVHLSSFRWPNCPSSSFFFGCFFFLVAAQT